MKALLFYILTTISATAFAQNTGIEPCRGDSECFRVKSWGHIRQPKEETLDFLRKLAPTIISAGKKYGVDPRAIAGAILTEATLNENIKDLAEDFLVNANVTPDGDLLGYQFSYGLGQIKCPAAKEADAYIARLENRARDPNACKNIRSVGGSIYLVAMIMREGQDVYAHYGFNIAGNPGLLATVYNCGEFVTRASSHYHKTQPAVNYFGWYVNYQLHVIENVLYGK